MLFIMRLKSSWTLEHYVYVYNTYAQINNSANDLDYILYRASFQLLKLFCDRTSCVKRIEIFLGVLKHIYYRFVCMYLL